jgi:hypothetical protein
MHQQEGHQQEDQEDREGQGAPEDRLDTPRRHRPDHRRYHNRYQRDQATLA